MEKLKLLSLGKNFKVEEIAKDVYDIQHINSELAATIDSDDIKYYLTGCYNSAFDWIEIEINDLLELKEFCELMIK